MLPIPRNVNTIRKGTSVKDAKMDLFPMEPLGNHCSVWHAPVLSQCPPTSKDLLWLHFEYLVGFYRLHDCNFIWCHFPAVLPSDVCREAWQLNAFANQATPALGVSGKWTSLYFCIRVTGSSMGIALNLQSAAIHTNQSV